jgi:hypothetical protein
MGITHPAGVLAAAMRARPHSPRWLRLQDRGEQTGGRPTSRGARDVVRPLVADAARLIASELVVAAPGAWQGYWPGAPITKTSGSATNPPGLSG